MKSFISDSTCNVKGPNETGSTVPNEQLKQSSSMSDSSTSTIWIFVLSVIAIVVIAIIGFYVQKKGKCMVRDI